MNYNSASIKTWARLGCNGAFGMAALELPQISDDIVILISDVCNYSGLSRFKKKYPEKLFNVGIAEQNMVGIAGGMAKERLVPYAATYATFASLRAADQVKMVMGYMNLGVKLVGLTSGLSTGILGPSHICGEDIAVMNAIPNITILSPADCTETVKAVLAAATMEGPVYIRLTGTMDAPIVYDMDYEFTVGKSITLSEGSDVAIIATGSIVYEAVEAGKKLKTEGISVSVIDVHTIKPFDESMIELLLDIPYVVTVEEHSIYGGLGSIVSAELLHKLYKGKVMNLGMTGQYHHAASYPYLLKAYGLDAESIVNDVHNLMKER